VLDRQTAGAAFRLHSTFESKFFIWMPEAGMAVSNSNKCTLSTELGKPGHGFESLDYFLASLFTVSDVRAASLRRTSVTASRSSPLKPFSGPAVKPCHGLDNGYESGNTFSDMPSPDKLVRCLPRVKRLAG
jgi:hypothetical protein